MKVSRDFQVPIVVTVNVTLEDDGTMSATGACVDSEGAPWLYSSDPAVWFTGDSNGDGQSWDMESGFPDDVEVRQLWDYAYDAVTDITVTP